MSTSTPPDMVLPAHISSRTTTAPSRTPVYALVGNPNCGKSTLFNALTGLKQKVGNYPGVTVEKKIGRTPQSAEKSVDLPVLGLPSKATVTTRGGAERDMAFTQSELLPPLPPRSCEGSAE